MVCALSESPMLEPRRLSDALERSIAVGQQLFALGGQPSHCEPGSWIFRSDGPVERLCHLVIVERTER